MKSILLLNDLPGYGKVALAASVPILTSFGYKVLNIPTAVISNTLDFGHFEILDTTEYMQKTLQVWKELEFPIDVISTGFIATKEQANFLVNFCKEKSEEGTFILCDPIMADHGRFYNGVTDEKVACMKQMISCSNVCTPNYTEAVFLTDSEYTRGPISETEIRELTDKLRALGAKSVVITSIELDNQSAVAGYDAECEEYFIVPFETIPVVFPGTGDIFSAIMLGECLNGKSLKEAVGIAVDIVWKLIDKNKDSEEKHHILLTTYLEEKRNA